MSPLLATLCLLASVPVVALIGKAVGVWLANRRAAAQATPNLSRKTTRTAEPRGAPPPLAPPTEERDFTEFLAQAPLYRTWLAAAANVLPEGGGIDVDKFEEDFRAYSDALGRESDPKLETEETDAEEGAAESRGGASREE